MNITVTIYVFDLEFSLYALKVPLEGRVSQIFYLAFSFYFMSKNGKLLVIFNLFFSKLHKIKTRA